MRMLRLLALCPCVVALLCADASASRGRQAPQLVNGAPLSDVIRGSAPERAWVYYEVYVPAGSTSLVVDLYGLSGDADLYVRRLDPPFLNRYDCRSARVGPASEQCVFSNPSPGLYWIGVNNWDAGPVGYTLRATWSCPAGGCNVISLQNGLPLADTITASTPQGGWKYYYVAVPPGGTSFLVQLTNLGGDVDLYLGRIDQPSLGSFQCRSFNNGTADELCAFELPSAGLWWVGVNNYDTGTIPFTLRTWWEVQAPPGTLVSDTIIGTAPQAAWNDSYVQVPQGATALTVNVTDVTGDVDLYLRRIDKPDLSVYDCRSIQSGLNPEQCTIPSPSPGLWWISINNYDTGPVHYVSRTTITCSGACAPAQGVVVGLGPGPQSPPRSAWAAYDPITSSYQSGVGPYAHYSTLQAGVNVGAAELDASAPGEMLTGPGNVAVFGPHVRAWAMLGAPMVRVNYFAYGTLRFGVKVRGIQGDADAYDEIVTGAGQGAVFGPHVRAWNLDAGALQSTATSFFAYPSYRYGVNVDAADMNGAGRDELLTAPVFGAGYQTQVRGWDIDVARQAIPISSINFYAFTNPNDRGCTVAAGDVDGDGWGEIVAGRGPVAGLAADVHGFTWDGANVYLFPELDFVAFSGYSYGTNLALPDLDGGGAAEIVAAPGPDPNAPPTLRALDFTGTGVAPIVGFDGMSPFAGDYASARQGANVDAGAR